MKVARAAEECYLDTSERWQNSFKIRTRCRTQDNLTKLTGILSLWPRSQVSGTQAQENSGLLDPSIRLLSFLADEHPKQLQVAALWEHPEVVRRLWFGCVSYAPLWLNCEPAHPQTFSCTSEGYSDCRAESTRKRTVTAPAWTIRMKSKHAPNLIQTGFVFTCYVEHAFWEPLPLK